MWKNDIALVKLEQDVPSGIEDLPRIQKITLNAADNIEFPPAGHMCYMKGWGCTDNGLSDVSSFFMVALCSRADHYIFILFLLSSSSSSSFFPRLISAVGDWMFTILRHMVWP